MRRTAKTNALHKKRLPEFTQCMYISGVFLNISGLEAMMQTHTAGAGRTRGRQSPPAQLSLLPGTALINEDGTYNIRAIRKQARMTQEDFAALLGVSPATYRSWEYRNHASGPALSLLKIAAMRPDVLKECLGTTAEEADVDEVA
jgi:DNA-binding transcriptional regulator YiaG